MVEEKQLGQIEYAHLGREDHGIFTCWIGFNFGISSQGFGGYAFDQYNEERDCREGSVFGMEVIMNIMDVAKVENWKDLVGKELFAIRDVGSDKIVGIEAPAYKGGGRFRFDELLKDLSARGVS